MRGLLVRCCRKQLPYNVSSYLTSSFVSQKREQTAPLMKFTDGTHLGDIMNTRDIREMIQKDLERE